MGGGRERGHERGHERDIAWAGWLLETSVEVRDTVGIVLGTIGREARARVRAAAYHSRLVVVEDPREVLEVLVVQEGG